MAEGCSCFWKENGKSTVRHGGWAGVGERGNKRAESQGGEFQTQLWWECEAQRAQ